MTKFTVNNQPVEYRMDPATPLLWALRDASNLTGTKYGCGTGHCGACIVDIDGSAKKSCLVPIGSMTKVEGHSLTLRGTVLSPDGSRRIVDTHRGPVDQPLNVGAELAARLLSAGARELLEGKAPPNR